MNIFKPVCRIEVVLGKQKAFNEYLDKRLDLITDYIKLKDDKITKLIELNKKQADLILELSKMVKERES